MRLRTGSASLDPATSYSARCISVSWLARRSRCSARIQPMPTASPLSWLAWLRSSVSCCTRAVNVARSGLASGDGARSMACTPAMVSPHADCGASGVACWRDGAQSATRNRALFPTCLRSMPPACTLRFKVRGDMSRSVQVCAFVRQRFGVACAPSDLT